MTFGAGPRNCPGQVFGEARLFLMVTSILQAFDILPEEGKEGMSVNFDDFELTMAYIPKPYKVRMIPRAN